nr:hypothetical protein [Tanacetum cinerariifolium]
MSSAEAEYVVASRYCAQVLWIKSQLADYDVIYDKHFIRDHILKGDIEPHFVPTDIQLADFITKPLAEPSFTRLVAELDYCISTALTKQPSAYYSKYLREFGILLSENFSSLPLKETVRAALATLGLVEEKDPSFSSTALVNSSPLRIRYFSPIWRVLMVYIVKSMDGMQGSHDQLNIKQQMIAYNLCWGLDIYIGSVYKNNKLKTFKPHHISITTFKIPSALKPKAPTDKKSRRKKNPSSSQPKTLKIVRESSRIKQVTATQHVEEPVSTADTTKSVDAFESAEVLGNRPKPTDVEKEVEEDFRIKSLGNVSFYVLYGNDLNMGADESPFNIESEIKFVRKMDPTLNINVHEAGSLLADKEITEDDHSKHKAEISQTDEATAADVIDEFVDLVNFNSLSAKVENLESFPSQRVADKIDDSMPIMNGKLTVCASSKAADKAILYKVGKSIKRNVKKEIRAINELLRLIDLVPASVKVATKRENVNTQAQSDPITEEDPAVTVPAPAQGEQQPNESTTEQVTTKEAPVNVHGSKRGSVPKLLNLQQFSTSMEGQMTLEDAKAQMEKSRAIQELKSQVSLVANQAGKLSFPPPPQLTAFEFLLVEKKSDNERKRMKDSLSAKPQILDTSQLPPLRKQPRITINRERCKE